jgi:lipooligosaccharide transport system ATP-binding protein
MPPGFAMTNDPNSLVIEAAGLRKCYGDCVAVNDVSFRVKAGEFFGILGPNGAGKTSTIRMLYGFSPPSGGTLNVLGRDIVTDWREIRSRIGVCTQDNNLDTDMSVRQNLETFAQFFGISRVEARARADRLLKFMGLDHRGKSLVNELSGGMMRRLVLARALLNEPELIILDEPTTGLDPQSRHQVWDRLVHLKQDGVSILLTTHYMEEASRLCDRVIFIDHGRILVEGSPRDLINRYVGSQVIEINQVSDDLRAFVKARGPAQEDLGYRLIVSGGEDGGLYREIVERFHPADCTLRVGTLEDVFLKLTGRELRE